MKNKKIKNIDKKLVVDTQNFMDSFRENVDILLDQQGYTMKDFSEKADTNFETLKTFLYSESKDCKLSTAVKFARVFGISIDELVGAGTINEYAKESLGMCRALPEHALYLIRSFIRHQYNIYNKTDTHSKVISVLLPECRSGYLPTTNVVKPLCIDHLTENLKSKVCLGLQVPCDNYEPYYMPGDILLIATDRAALNNEKCVLTYRGNIFISTKKYYIEDGQKKYKYASLIDPERDVLPNEVDEKIGYVVGFLNPDGSWGIR